MADTKHNPDTAKDKDLAANREDSSKEFLTTDQGVRVNDNQNSLKAGAHGPSLLEDFHLREKIMHFDHERIPERVVHARGSGAHGFFQVYESLAPITRASFLQNPATKTPVFVRFSTVAGSRGSSDLARDVRGFATKFYTEEGNFDLVGNNMPVFFIQDAIKFPDFVHAVKPEPHHEMPQAASAHDTFWDFISLTPESMHTIMWVMSDRALPRSYRMMQGFGVHTFRMINERGECRFVKFHWKPMLGVHSVLWDEAQKISGKDPDFHRRDLWQAIENGDFPEYELGLQVVEEADEHSFDFDLTDPTKLIPEELVPVRPVGKLTLNRNPDNFFAETEQIAFCIANVVPGIDFTDDPLLQGRLFSYQDTQLTRLGGPNFHEIPINRPVAPVHNDQRDGHMRQTINVGQTSYEPNTISGGYPVQARAKDGGYVTYPERLMDAAKLRARSEKFFDHFSQATLFYNSQSEIEKLHIAQALEFELGNVQRLQIRERMLFLLTRVDRTLAERVAHGLGLRIPEKVDQPLNMNIPADAKTEEYQPMHNGRKIVASPALSMATTPRNTIKTRQIAILAADGVDETAITDMQKALKDAGAQARIVAPRLGFLRSAKGRSIPVDYSLMTGASVFFDALYLPGGAASVDALRKDPDALLFIIETFKHCKAIAANGEGVDLLHEAHVGSNGTGPDTMKTDGIVVNANGRSGRLAEDFIHAIMQHRFWNRQMMMEKAAMKV
ncbi:MAG TPA: catalase [bacterium]|jgi:catalase